MVAFDAHIRRLEKYVRTAKRLHTQLQLSLHILSQASHHEHDRCDQKIFIYLLI